MKAIILQRWRLRWGVLLLLVAGAGRGQTVLHWSSYTMADGLSEPVFNSVAFVPQGKLLVTSPHAPLAAELDGYAVTHFPGTPWMLGSLGESPGGQRWAMSAQGLGEFKDDAWRLHPVPEIAAAVRAANYPPGSGPPFLPIRQDCVLFLLPDGLMEFSEENLEGPRTAVLRRPGQSRIGNFTGMASAGDGGLWISGAHGVLKLAGPVRNISRTSDCQEFPAPAWLGSASLRQPEPDNAGGVVFLTESAGNQKAVVTFDGQTWAALPAGTRNFSHAWRGPDQALWASTAEALFRWSFSQTNWVENEDISPGVINDVTLEPGGAFWLATADGLFRGSLPLWSKVTSSEFDEPVPALAGFGESAHAYISLGKLHLWQNHRDQTFALPLDQENSGIAPALWPLKNNALVVTEENEFWEFSLDKGFCQPPLPSGLGKVRPIGTLSDGSVCFARADQPSRLIAFDGSQWQPLVNSPPVPAEDPSFTLLYSARNGDLWLAGGPVVWVCHNSVWRRFFSTDVTTPRDAIGFADLPDGNVCCATADQLWEFDGHNWVLLKTRFNHINALHTGHDGSVWLASNGGLYRYCSGVWLDNGPEEGLPNGSIYALGESRSGQLWAATPHGVCEFHPEAGSDSPRTSVRTLTGAGQRLPEGENLNLVFEGADKWKYTPAERLVYSYQLDQLGWTAFCPATFVSLQGQAAGRHYFQVRAMDRNGHVDTLPATLEFTILTPWFRETRLWIVAVLGAAAALFFAALAWHRHVLLVRSHAAIERTVAERTRELEIATNELLHSQKMNALGTLAAGIAHDFNNILSIIKGSAQIIEDNPGQPEKIRTRLARIKTVVQQGAEIVEAMLGFSRGSGAPVPCNINEVVAGTLKLLGDRFLREAEVTFVRGDDLPELFVSREFIQQILINLIFNAAEAMADHKKILLTTARAEHVPGDIFLPPLAAPAFILISVQDEGCGMAPEILARIFEPFFTTKALSARRGTGLGLSMVYELAKKMGAGLAVKSTVGRGSEFVLILPVLPVLDPEPIKNRPADSLPA